MTVEEKQEIKEIVESCSVNINTRMEAQNIVINTKLDGINSHLSKINGSVQRHESQITEALTERLANRQKQEDKFKVLDGIEGRVDVLEKEDIIHYQKCPVAPQVRKLQDESLGHKSVKKFMGLMFAGGIALGGLIVGIIELALKLGGG